MYALVVTYDFDPDTVVYMFKTWDEAVKYMKAMWQMCCSAEKAESPDFDEEDSKCDEKNGMAELKWKDDAHRYWQVVSVDEPEPIPEEYYA